MAEATRVICGGIDVKTVDGAPFHSDNDIPPPAIGEHDGSLSHVLKGNGWKKRKERSSEIGGREGIAATIV
ncbi:hypothetical protein L6452_22225 [Arctium lappa]|uniref:Uncharacterized protein n=1 Tax=Arctium lappa TaxID=4217 RepID=A0ACB9AYC5_ARCLA|nr:hypothetical protein L6452_22225 [Arctium lappa]